MSASETCYADHAAQTTVEIIENVRLARDTYRVRFACPDIAARIVPGQFLMLRLAGCDDPLLGRPFAFYNILPDAAGRPAIVDVVYLVLGKMTARMSRCVAGDRLEVWGPLGKGFPIEPTDELIMVAGGIGQTPFLAVGKEALGVTRYGSPAQLTTPIKNVTLLYGARRAEYLAGLDQFAEAGIRVLTSTDDGSAGHHGFVTDLLKTELARPAAGTRRIVCCGPEPMMEAVAEIAAHAETPCRVSLESPMACGIGICFSCVVKVKQPEGDWDYRRTCVEGPVFDAAQIAW
ncbi:MAG: dihydroorotate dehydrogenase electron transfer subunit [Pirellulales bacterium]